MIIIDVEQRTPEWHALRTIPTASAFKDILTPMGKPCTGAKTATYQNTLIAQWMTGPSQHHEDSFSTPWMQRGIDMEEEAIGFYEMRMGVDVDLVGFVLHDSELFGCSPDALMPASRAGMELKCPKASTHIGYLLNGKLPTEYIPQVQGSLLVTGYDYWDFMSYHPDLEPLIIRVFRDEVYLERLAQALMHFTQGMEKKKQQLIEQGYHHAA